MGKVHTLVGKVHTRKYAKIYAVNKKIKIFEAFFKWHFLELELSTQKVGRSGTISSIPTIAHASVKKD